MINDQAARIAKDKMHRIIENFNRDLAGWHKEYPDLVLNLGWDYRTPQGYQGVKMTGLKVNVFEPEPDLERAKKHFSETPQDPVEVTPK